MSAHGTATFELPGARSAVVRCTACANRACEALGDVPGVSKVDCDAMASTVRVEFDARRVSESELVSEMERFGLELAESLRHEAWRVTGLD